MTNIERVELLHIVLTQMLNVEIKGSEAYAKLYDLRSIGVSLLTEYRSLNVKGVKSRIIRIQERSNNG